MSSELNTSDAFGKMPSLYTSARPVSTGERSVASGQAVSGAELSGSRPSSAQPARAGSGDMDLDREALEEKAAELSEFMQSRQRDLSFSVDDDTGRTVVKVINAQTEEVVRQIPSEELLEIARRIEDGESGMLELEA